MIKRLGFRRVFFVRGDFGEVRLRKTSIMRKITDKLQKKCFATP